MWLPACHVNSAQRRNKSQLGDDARTVTLTCPAMVRWSGTDRPGLLMWDLEPHGSGPEDGEKGGLGEWCLR